MAFEYVLFDLDGTLTDPGEGITNSVAYALERYGAEVPEKQQLYKFIGPPLVSSFKQYCGFSHEKACEAVGVYREYFREKGMFENEVYPGIPEMLQNLKKEGKRLIVATSKPGPFSVRILEHFGLAEYFEFVAASNMDETRTEKWEVIEYALSSCGIDDLSRTVMVGDREHDIMGAVKNKIGSIGVLYGYGSREELENAGAERIASSVGKLAGMLSEG